MRKQIHNMRWPQIIAVLAGNTLEWFEFVIFGFFAATLGPIFFPAESEAASTLAAFGAFGVTFLMRPIGAILIGRLADRKGRGFALTVTFTLMAISSAIIAFAPTFATVGIGATIIVVFSRMIQGLSVGGEFGSATAILTEADPTRRGFFGSLQFASQGVSAMLASATGTALGLFLTSEQLYAWGWRLPFLLGLLMAPAIMYLRRALPNEYDSFMTNESHAELSATGSLLGRFLAAGGLVVLATVAAYTMIYLPSYSKIYLHIPTSEGFISGLIAAIIQVFIVPLSGAASDKAGRSLLMFISSSLILVTALPLFSWLADAPSFTKLLTVQIVLGTLTAVYVGGLPALMAELFPAQVRAGGLSISYTVAVAAFGGSAPFISSSLITLFETIIAPSLYLGFSAIISLFAICSTRFLLQTIDGVTAS